MARSAGADGRQRAVIESVAPIVDRGRFPIKRCAGDIITVEADAFADGHDQLRCVLLHRRRGDRTWNEVEMAPLGNDRWRGHFTAPEVGVCEYTIATWVDHYLSWRHDLQRWSAPEDIAVALAVGAQIIAAAAARAKGVDGKRLGAWAKELAGAAPVDVRRERALDAELDEIIARYPDRSLEIIYQPALAVTVDPPRARFSAWYEMFPRASAGPRHGTFRDCEARLAYVAELGFDVLYFPPIHPIGVTRRKGPNNATTSRPGDPGSPWAIGAKEGGHKAIAPELGTTEDFRRLVRTARSRGIEIALDIAFQCSPDHPYVSEHPEWFRHRPDGSVQYAENPPKKYQDIYPFNFETPAWRELWEELKSIFDHWIGEGVRIFRVDNPHTKPFAMWEWMIGEIKNAHPDVIFLSEAFTRPRIMHRLAKLGFTQSYTYFTWRNTKAELTEYFTELSRSWSREYFRPNAWPNTPDILHAYLQGGGRPAFMARLTLAATLAANYGIYGPTFELMEHEPREAGSEEYLNSEKYEIRNWNLDRADSLRDFIARVNRIRRANPALHADWRLAFHRTDNDQIICYSKSTPDLSNVILVVVNLDPVYRQSGWVDLTLEELGVAAGHAYPAHDLLTDSRFTWHGSRNYVELDPQRVPAHILHITPGHP
ncbi:MAG TPA: alpha-1,4-glucan--maltose-1-phosphate maltosyltransferase [Burkholderiales bacterium]|nr:alpha-1,4-glucan--maltose-1-phosphate maltosyltransferase [Burkholderiales bacterium]